MDHRITRSVTLVGPKSGFLRISTHEGSTIAPKGTSLASCTEYDCSVLQYLFLQRRRLYAAQQSNMMNKDLHCLAWHLAMYCCSRKSCHPGKQCPPSREKLIIHLVNFTPSRIHLVNFQITRANLAYYKPSKFHEFHEYSIANSKKHKKQIL